MIPRKWLDRFSIKGWAVTSVFFYGSPAAVVEVALETSSCFLRSIRRNILVSDFLLQTLHWADVTERHPVSYSLHGPLRWDPYRCRSPRGRGGVNKQVSRSGSQLFTKQQCKAPGELRGELIPHGPTQLLHVSPKRMLIIHTSANLTCILKPERCENMAIFMKTKQRISKEHPTQTRAKHHVSASALPCPRLLSQVAGPLCLLHWHSTVGRQRGPDGHALQLHSGNSEAQSVIHSHILSVLWQPPAKHEVLQNTVAVESRKIRFFNNGIE